MTLPALPARRAVPLAAVVPCVATAAVVVLVQTGLSLELTLACTGLVAVAAAAQLMRWVSGDLRRAAQALRDGAIPEGSHLRGLDALDDLIHEVHGTRQRVWLLEALLARHESSAQEAHHLRSGLFTELVRAEEATRASIAADLHDTVAQSLSRVLRMADGLTSTAFEEPLEVIRDAEEQLRAALARVRPPELSEGDLASAVEHLCADVERRYGTVVAVDWKMPADLALSVPVATTVFRFVQETLLNAVEHTDTETVRLGLVVEGRALTASVADDGPGFDAEAVVSGAGRHVGLALARDRARLAGGSLVVDSAPGRGTTVRLTLPISLPAPVPVVPRQPSAAQR